LNAGKTLFDADQNTVLFRACFPFFAFFFLFLFFLRFRILNSVY